MDDDSSAIWWQLTVAGAVLQIVLGVMVCLAGGIVAIFSIIATADAPHDSWGGLIAAMIFGGLCLMGLSVIGLVETVARKRLGPVCVCLIAAGSICVFGYLTLFEGLANGVSLLPVSLLTQIATAIVAVVATFRPRAPRNPRPYSIPSQSGDPVQPHCIERGDPPWPSGPPQYRGIER